MIAAGLGRVSAWQTTRHAAVVRDRWPIFAVFMAIGYLTTSRSFAYLGIPPLKLFIGEIALALFLATRPRAVVDLWLNTIRTPGPLRAFSILLAAFLVYGGFELARGIALGRPILYAAHDFSFQYYGLYFFVGMYAGLRRPETLRTIAVCLGWANGIYGVIFVAFLSRAQVPLAQTEGVGVNPGSVVTLFGQPYGSAIAILGLLCFDGRRRIFVPLLLNGFVLLAMDIRSEWLGFVTGIVMLSLLTRRLTMLLAGAGAIAALLAISFALDISVPKPASRGGGTTSARDIVGRILAPVDPSAAAEYSDTVRVAAATASWRSAWWQSIWYSIRDNDQLLLIGHGYGYPLTDLVSYLRGRHYIRTPHSYIFFALGYGGCIMLVLLALLQLSLLRLLIGAFKITGQPFGAVTWTVLLTWGLFDSFLESPYRAAPFFIITGAAVAPLLMARPFWRGSWVSLEPPAHEPSWAAVARRADRYGAPPVHDVSGGREKAT